MSFSYKNLTNYPPLGIFTGALMRKFGNRPTAIFGFVVYASGLALSSIALTVPVLYFTLGIMTGKQQGKLQI